MPSVYAYKNGEKVSQNGESCSDVELGLFQLACSSEASWKSGWRSYDNAMQSI